MATIKAIVIDVDGTLTDGTISYSSDGTDSKSFHVSDGLGIVLARLVGIEIWIISGRVSAAVVRRAAELGVDRLFQGVSDKRSCLLELQSLTQFKAIELAYIGDDINDLSAFSLVETKIAVGNASHYLKLNATFTTTLNGGRGAVREAIEWLLNREDKLNLAIEMYSKHCGTSAGQ